MINPMSKNGTDLKQPNGHLQEDDSIGLRTTIRTFRLGVDVLDYVEKISNRKGTTVNAFVNQLLKQQMETGSLRESFLYVCFSRELIEEIFSKMDESSIISIGQKCGISDYREAIMHIELPNNEEGAYIFIKKMVCELFNFADYHEIYLGTSIEGKKAIALTHEKGMRWSIFLREYLLSLLKAHVRNFRSDSIQISKCTVTIPLENFV